MRVPPFVSKALSKLSGPAHGAGSGLEEKLAAAIKAHPDKIVFRTPTTGSGIRQATAPGTRDLVARGLPHHEVVMPRPHAVGDDNTAQFLTTVTGGRHTDRHSLDAIRAALAEMPGVKALPDNGGFKLPG